MASYRPNGEFCDVAEVNLATRIPNAEPVAQLLALGCTVLVNWDDWDDIQLVAYLPVGRKGGEQLIRQVDDLLIACYPDNDCEIVGDADLYRPDDGRYLLVM